MTLQNWGCLKNKVCSRFLRAINLTHDIVAKVLLPFTRFHFSRSSVWPILVYRKTTKRSTSYDFWELGQYVALVSGLQPLKWRKLFLSAYNPTPTFAVFSKVKSARKFSANEVTWKVDRCSHRCFSSAPFLKFVEQVADSNPVPELSLRQKHVKEESL